ncbi:MAG: hypothetical protein H7Y20_15225 [Bryobacteraceae bacterium]|nr:hypothetical protein [Bryobacteraceae bacterium]
MATRRRYNLQRLFSTFPGGWPGAGLMLLRAAVGGTAIVQGGRFLSGSVDLTLWMWLTGLLSILSGISLLVGFLTPVVGGIAAVGVTSMAFFRVPLPALNLFDATLQTVLIVLVAIAVALLGPGALSADARLFGRREIIIPANSRVPKTE